VPRRCAHSSRSAYRIRHRPRTSGYSARKHARRSDRTRQVRPFVPRRNTECFPAGSPAVSAQIGQVNKTARSKRTLQSLQPSAMVDVETLGSYYVSLLLRTFILVNRLGLTCWKAPLKLKHIWTIRVRSNWQTERGNGSVQFGNRQHVKILRSPEAAGGRCVPRRSGRPPRHHIAAEDAASGSVRDHGANARLTVGTDPRLPENWVGARVDRTASRDRINHPRMRICLVHASNAETIHGPGLYVVPRQVVIPTVACTIAPAVLDDEVTGSGCGGSIW
jgi:hypothetical protein